MLDILIVEDDPKWQRTFEWLISGMGHTPVVAPSYGEALVLLRNKEFSLAIIDLWLNGIPEGASEMEGRILAREARCVGIPVIITTGFGSLQLATELVNVHRVRAYIAKQTFDGDRFREYVQIALESGKAKNPPPPTKSDPEQAPSPSTSRIWLERLRDRAVHIGDEIIAAAVVGALASLAGVFTGWLQSNPVQYGTFVLVCMIVVFVAVIALRRAGHPGK